MDKGPIPGSSPLLKIVQNTGWLLSERAVIMGTGMFVGILVARYLGPTDFGTYSYALAVVGLFGFLPIFGLQGIVTRELIKTPENSDEILGTVLSMRLVGALIGVAGVIAFVMLKPGDLETRLMIGIVGAGLVFDAFGVIDLWFQSRTENKYSVIARTSSLLIGLALKVLLVLAGAPLLAFAVVEALQHALRSIGFIVAYRWAGHVLTRWRRNWTLAKNLLQQSWPVVLSSAGALVYLQIDQVMLGELVGAQEVGVYAVAARLSEAWYVIPMAISTAVFPSIVLSKQEQDPGYSRQLQNAYTAMVWLALSIAIAVTIAAGPVIELLYGSEYSGSSRILAVHIWTCPAVFMGAILNKWLIAEDLLIFALTRHGLGAAVNLGLNIFLIPAYGGLGAAIATLISYSVAYYLACYTDRRTRDTGKMMTRAIFSPVTLPAGYVLRAIRS